MSGHFDDDAALDAELARGYQCWICDHCIDDRLHHSESGGCEQEATYGLRHRIQIGPLDV